MAECACGADREVRLLYACSGMANTGLLADRVWRKLAAEKVGAGTCLAAVGAGISGFLGSARGAARNIVLDGCKVACGARIFENAGLDFEHFVMTDFEVEKGVTPITGDLVDAIASRVAGRIEDKARA